MDWWESKPETHKKSLRPGKLTKLLWLSLSTQELQNEQSHSTHTSSEIENKFPSNKLTKYMKIENNFPSTTHPIQPSDSSPSLERKISKAAHTCSLTTWDSWSTTRRFDDRPSLERARHKQKKLPEIQSIESEENRTTTLQKSNSVQLKRIKRNSFPWTTLGPYRKVRQGTTTLELTTYSTLMCFWAETAWAKGYGLLDAVRHFAGAL